MAGLLGVVETTQNKTTLIAQNNYGPVLQKVTLTGGPYLRGQVLGVITATGKYSVYNNAALDGTEVAKAILWDDADGSLADVQAVVCLIGVMREANLIGLDAPGRADLSTARFFFA